MGFRGEGFEEYWVEEDGSGWNMQKEKGEELHFRSRVLIFT